MPGREAWLRATREMAGMTQADVARDLGVTAHTVKRWEREDMPNYSAPASALDYMEGRRAAFLEAVESRLAVAGGGRGPVTLVYYRDQEAYDALAGTPGSHAQENAVTLALAVRLMEEGADVEWAYAPAPGTH